MDLEREHQESNAIFEKLFQTDDGQSIGCDIWRALVGGDEESENCIGENFNQILWTLKENWFGNSNLVNCSLEFYYTTYLLWLYLVVARAYEVFDAVNEGGKNPMINKERLKLKTFNEINLWAKFIKHPKEFIFCHWPEYCCEGSMPTKKLAPEERVLINLSYLKQHYTSENDDRPVSLKNNTNVIVQYPKLTRITSGFVEDLEQFRDFVCQNKMIIDALKKDTNTRVQAKYSEN